IDMSKARLVWHHGGQGEVTGLTYRGRTDIAARYAGTDVWIDGHRVHTSAVRQMVGDVDVLLRAGGAMLSLYLAADDRVGWLRVQNAAGNHYEVLGGRWVTDYIVARSGAGPWRAYYRYGAETKYLVEALA